MATATTDRIGQLREECDQINAECDQINAELQEKVQALRAARVKQAANLREMADAIEAADGDVGSVNVVSQRQPKGSSNSAPAPKRGPGRPPGSGKRGPGRPPSVNKNKTKPKGKSSGRNYGQETSLKAEIWRVVDEALTNKKFAKKFIPDYPDDGVGLKISEIKLIIEQEAKWTSSSDNLAPQIQGHLHALIRLGKFGRDEETHRYWIVDKAELDGPPLDENGKVMKEDSDGNFLLPNGKVFELDGKPYRMRRKTEA